MKAAIHAARPGLSPVIQRLRRPVKIGDSAPITDMVAVLTSVSEVT
jgi:hypothetical protein